MSTLLVTPPSKTAEIPLRPCEAMTMTSQPLSFAVVMIAWVGVDMLDLYCLARDTSCLGRFRYTIQYPGRMLSGLLGMLCKGF